jgi:anti-sigma factor RsiW
MNPHHADPLIARYADDESSLPPGVREQLASHLAVCIACRAALDEQRDVAALLRGRLASTPRPGLVARVSARIDSEAGENGWLGLANWRGWAAALVPLAAALLVAAYVDLGRATSTTPSNAVVPTFDELTIGDVPAVLQPSLTGDALIEAVLTGAAPSSGDVNVR